MYMFVLRLIANYNYLVMNNYTKSVNNEKNNRPCFNLHGRKKKFGGQGGIRRKLGGQRGNQAVLRRSTPGYIDLDIIAAVNFRTCQDGCVLEHGLPVCAMTLFQVRFKLMTDQFILVFQDDSSILLAFYQIKKMYKFK